MMDVKLKYANEKFVLEKKWGKKARVFPNNLCKINKIYAFKSFW